jgi:anti-anti-sigma regulatory factor
MGTLRLNGGDHVCASYSSQQELHAIVDGYLEDAVAMGRRAVFLDADGAVARYGDRPTTDPHGLIAEFDAMARGAVNVGFSGLAIAADATGLVTTPLARQAFCRVEHLADRVIRASGTMTGLCLYDANQLDENALDELGVLHQQLAPNDTSFHLCASGAEGLRLDGELDFDSVELFERMLSVVVWDAPSASEELFIDAVDLDFLDRRSLQVLDGCAAGDDRRVVLRGARPIVHRLIEVSGVHHVSAELVA